MYVPATETSPYTIKDFLSQIPLKAKLHVHGPERRASFGFALTGAFFYAMNPVAALGFRG
jgi:hypothetical protein